MVCFFVSQVLNDTHSWFDFAWQLPYAPHGPVHEYVGGVLDCDSMFDDVKDVIYDYIGHHTSVSDLVYAMRTQARASTSRSSRLSSSRARRAVGVAAVAARLPTAVSCGASGSLAGDGSRGIVSHPTSDGSVLTSEESPSAAASAPADRGSWTCDDAPPSADADADAAR